MSKVVGIDLGTTFSAIAHVNEHGQEEIIPNAESDRITPSVIMFEEDLITVGKVAKQNASAVPEDIVEFIKREIGKSKAEFGREFAGKQYSAEELSALILQKLKQDAEAYLNAEVTDAVITVPAYFKDAEREATRNAGKIAGLNVLQVMNEPTAAALAYGVDVHGSDQNVFVFDLGGGTFDVTVMKVSGSKLEMIATNGDHRLGGKDWDDQIIVHVAQMFEEEHSENPLQDLHAYQDIQLSAISAKESLSQRQKARIVCNYNGKSSRIELTREKFQEITNDLVQRCSALCGVVLSEAGMTWENIDLVLLVGGSTRMPMIQEMITEISGKEINPQEVNPDDAVALGAAIQGTLRQIEEQASGTSDTNALAEMPEAVKDRFIGPKGELAIKVVDGATHHLGIVLVKSDTVTRYVHLMIPKMTPVPCEVQDTFYTVSDYQPGVQIEVVQGLEEDQLIDEIPQFEEIYKLGECELELPSGMPANTPFDVTYKYNLDQTLEVTAKGPGGKTANAKIDRSTLDAAEVEEAADHMENLEIE
ncbi:MAG: Hsp70 family protein [Candidatus Poribacteria bacterium]|nr:Hsp70 family protein [Candidatus Poribacteria bacterium]